MADITAKLREQTSGNRWHRILIGLGIFLLAGHLMVGQAAAVGESEEEPEIFGEEIEVRVINLEVQVTDGDGKHLPGLGADDFRLEVDGELVPIGYFSEIRERHAVASATAGSTGVAEPQADPAGSTTFPSITPGERVPTSFLVFVDNVFSYPQDRKLVLEGMGKTIDALGPGDQMAIVSYDGRRLEQVGDWTSSPELLEDALDRALAAPALGLQRLGEVSVLDRLNRRQGADLIQSADSFNMEDYIRDLSGKIERTMLAVTSALRSFADPPGRKVMLLASGGWPRDPSVYAGGFNPAMRSRTRHYFPTAAFDDLIGTANLLGYTLYPIDVPGNRVRARQASAELSGSDIDGISDSFGSAILNRLGADDFPRPPVLETELATAADVLGGNLEIDNATSRELENEATLIELAERTGGRALLNSGRLAVIEEVVADTSSYYWLGFTRNRQNDDREHEIKIAVSQPGAEVRSRRGFRDMSRRREVAMQVESSLLSEFEPADEVLEVELGTPQGRRRVQQPVTLRVPLDHIVMLPGASGFSGQLELRVASIDNKGARSPLPALPLFIGGTEAPQPGQVAVVDVVLQLRNTQQELLLAVHDLAGDTVLTASVEYQPPVSR